MSVKGLLRNAHNSISANENQNMNNNQNKKLSINHHDRLHVGYRQNTGDTNRPLSVMVDIVSHDEPSVCSLVSNGPTYIGMTQPDHQVNTGCINMIICQLIFRGRQARLHSQYQERRKQMGVCAVCWVSDASCVTF